MLFGALALAGLLVLVVAGNLGVRLTGVGLPRESVEARIGRLTPDLRWFWPEGGGKAGVLLLFSGCDGPRDNMVRWAEMAVAEGWAALIVDSHRPRGLEADPMWRLVCSAQALTGAERAGDVAAALEIARGQEGVNPERLVLLGASHGGWAVLELLGFHEAGRRPDGLRRWPGGGRVAALEGLAGVILLYPYCGRAARMLGHGWEVEVPIRMVLVDGDAIANPAPCAVLASRMEAAGRPVVVERVTGVTHGFDQRDRAPFSTLRYDADATAQVLAAGAAFLDGLGPAPE